MINVMPIFINFLAVEALRIDNDRLEKFCLEAKRRNAGRTISNGGGWQSGSLDLNTPELAELFTEAVKRLNELHRAYEFKPSLRQVITEAWININQKGHYNLPHDHAGSLFSAVYYVKGGPDKGGLELLTPIAPHTYTISDEMIGAYNAFNGGRMVLTPVTGELLIFPSWLLHHVHASHSDEDRISIAFNSRMIAAS